MVHTQTAEVKTNILLVLDLSENLYTFVLILLQRYCVVWKP